MIWLTPHSITLVIVQQTDCLVRKPGKLRGCWGNLGTAWCALNPGGGNGGGYIDLPSSQRWKWQDLCGVWEKCSVDSKVWPEPVLQTLKCPAETECHSSHLQVDHASNLKMSFSFPPCLFFSFNKAAWNQFVYNLKIPEDLYRLKKKKKLPPSPWKIPIVFSDTGYWWRFLSACPASAPDMQRH